jgi:hypothetical protein
MKFREPFLAFLRRSHLPCTAEFVLKVAEDFTQWVEDKVEAAHWAKLDMRQRADHLLERRASRRARGADDAVNDGIYLLQSKKVNPEEWSAFLADLRISPRTAQNLMALALFSMRWPELYAGLKTLGPTKLYRIARLREDQIAEITLDTEVELGRGLVKLRHLSDAELQTYLRERFPDRPARLWTRATASIRKARPMLENAVHRDGIPATELEVFISEAQSTLKYAVGLRSRTG